VRLFDVGKKDQAPMKVGIVGNEQAKFTLETEAKARNIITELLSQPDVTHVVSGHCHLGGVDIYAEEIGKQLGLTPLIFPPKSHNWSTGYKPRNIQIAQASDIVHVIVLSKLPDSYQGRRFTYCYHCKTDEHVKSGACWTAKYAISLGKRAIWHII